MHNSREKHRLNIMDLENRLSCNSEKRRKIYQTKWRLTHEKLPIEKN